MKLRERIRNWLGMRNDWTTEYGPTNPIKHVHQDNTDLRESLYQVGASRFTIHKAANGYIVEVGHYKQNMNGPDWTFEHHVTTDGAELFEIVRRVLAVKALE